ncbi:MAG: S41 family peptidase, partial [Planctomycetota bacterium]
EWWGSSSDHSLFSSLGNRFLPFGESQSLECLFLSPEGKTRKVELRRWGPGGKAFYPWTVQFPEGVTWKKGALARMLETKWCRKLGWLRITGSMDEATVRAFHRAFDTLRGMEALLLDCRSMGGGSDSEAWEMAGRLFEKPVPNGSGRRLEPTGSWQFAGPVVMLQNESEVSSAWAVSETERVVSVGRPTGGWGIIPEIHKCPSGLVDFRLGVNDRPTPIKGIRTEGVGWPPDIRVPYGPVFCARADPDREIGMECLRLLHAGVTRKQLLDAFQSLFRGDLAGYRRKAARLEKKAKGWKSKLLDDRVRDDLKATLVMELRLLEEKKVVAPDALGARERVKELALRARKAKLAGLASRWQKALSKLKNEAKAQETLLDLLDTDFTLDPKQKKSFLEKHGKTRLGRWVREKL